MKPKFDRRAFGLLLLPVLALLVAGLSLRGKSVKTPSETPFGLYKAEDGFSVELRADGTCFVNARSHHSKKPLKYRLIYNATGFEANIYGSGFGKPLVVGSYVQQNTIAGYVFLVRKFFATEHNPVLTKGTVTSVTAVIHDLTKEPCPS